MHPTLSPSCIRNRDNASLKDISGLLSGSCHTVQHLFSVLSNSFCILVVIWWQLFNNDDDDDDDDNSDGNADNLAC